MWNLAEYGDSPAVIESSGTVLTYAELKAETEALAEKIGRRCLVFSLCRNTIGSLIGYVACLNGRIPPIMLSSTLDEALLENLLSVYAPAYIWCPEEQAAQFPGTEPVYAAYGYALLKTDFPKEYPLYDELGLLLTTSGSTGSPKFVRQSYANILDNAQSIVQYLKLSADERPITTLPMNYTYGLSIINSHLLVGAAILMTEKGLMQKEFWSFFREAGATSFGGVPYTYEMLDRLRFYRMQLPSLRTMTQAGGKILPELHEKFAAYAEETGRQFVVMYGQCEATARMGFLPPEMAAAKKGSMGIAIPGGKFRLIGADGSTVTAPHTTGELVYEGKNVTLGYAECGDDLSRGDERGGILETGDMAQFDEDGYYYIVGRKKRFLKIYGNRVNLDETERMIRSEFQIEAACAGKDDHMELFVTDAAFAEPVREFVVRKTRLNPAAFRVTVIDAIPKNDAGKTLYRELQKYYE